MSTSVIPPVSIPSTLTSANPLPKFSTSISSLLVYNAPLPSISDCATIDFNLKLALTSVTVDTAVIISPSWKLPTTVSISNSVTEVEPCRNVIVSTTIAVARDVCPVITWFTISSAAEPIVSTLIVVF